MAKIERTGPASILFYPSPLSNHDDVALIHDIMEALKPPATLPFVKATTFRGEETLTFCLGSNTLKVNAETPEDRRLFDDLKLAIAPRGGDLISARIWCDGGWMGFFTVPGWQDKAHLAAWLAERQKQSIAGVAQ